MIQPHKSIQVNHTLHFAIVMINGTNNGLVILIDGSLSVVGMDAAVTKIMKKMMMKLGMVTELVVVMVLFMARNFLAIRTMKTN